MSSIGQSGGTDPRLLGREALDFRQLHEEPATVPARGRPSETTAAMLLPQELKPTEKAPAEYKACTQLVVRTAPTRFHGLVGGAWQRALHARFQPETVAATAPLSDGAKKMDSVLTEASPSPESDWWLDMQGRTAEPLLRSKFFCSSGGTYGTVPGGLQHCGRVVPDGDRGRSDSGSGSRVIIWGQFGVQAGFSSEQRAPPPFQLAAHALIENWAQMSIGQSGGADPRLLGREAFDVRELHEELKPTEKAPAEHKVDEVVQTAPTRLGVLMGGAWQRALHARFSSTTDESEDAADQASFHPGDFRMLPPSPSAWEALHARFQPETVAATAETSAFASVLLAPWSHGPKKMDSEPLDARLNYANC
ncbi:unnamed protein product [Symbiodinium sp. CCMP2592]|nr:unnamed protein product [Symbiodinium sp. CCMP2592]